MKAYAARCAEHGVLPATVGPTIRAAMVDALYLKGIVVTNRTTNDMIIHLWRTHAPSLGLDIVRVTIRAHGPVDVEGEPIA